MTLMENQTPDKKPRARKPWADWAVITLTLACAWCGLCWLVQAMAAG